MRLTRNDFESDLLGRRIFRVEMLGNVTSSELAERISSAPEHELLEWSAEPEQLEQMASAVACGFAVADTAIDFECPVSTASVTCTVWDAHIREATASDLEALRDICRRVRFPSRFYRPPFTGGDGDRFYIRWIENSVEGLYDEVCLINPAETGHGGFVTLRRVSAEACRVGLIGIVPAAHGQGIAQALWKAACNWSRSHGRQQLHVATQLHNRRAIRFYEKMGGSIRATRIHFYRTRSGVAE